MPRGGGFAAEARKIVAEFRASGESIELERAPCATTGFTNVVYIKGQYQARLQVPGDGRGGIVKRKQCALPGLFPNAEDAAIYLALVKRDMKAANDGKLVAPPAIDKQHKPRSRQRLQPAATQLRPQPEPPQLPMTMAMTTPLAMPMLHVPFATVSPLLPMRPLGYTPPRF